MRTSAEQARRAELGSLQLSELTTGRIDAVLDDLATQSLNCRRKAKCWTWLFAMGNWP